MLFHCARFSVAWIFFARSRLLLLEFLSRHIVVQAANLGRRLKRRIEVHYPLPHITAASGGPRRLRHARAEGDERWRFEVVG